MSTQPRNFDLQSRLIQSGMKRTPAINLANELARYAQTDYLCDRSQVDGLVAEALYALHVQPFLPGDDVAFWLSDAGQCLASALYQAHEPDLIAPREAGKLIWDVPQAEKNLKVHVMRRRLRAIPMPLWAQPAQTFSARKSRGEEGRIRWFVLRSEVDSFRASRG